MGLNFDWSDFEYERLIVGNLDRNITTRNGIYNVHDEECKQLEVFKGN